MQPANDDIHAFARGTFTATALNDGLFEASTRGRQTAQSAFHTQVSPMPVRA